MASPQLAQDQLLGGVPARIEVDGPEDGLEGVRQDGGLGPPAGGLLAPAQQQDLAHAEALGHLGQHAGVHHGRAHLGQHPLGEVGVALVAVAGHDETEDGVAEELEAFVGRRPALLLAAPAPMGQRVLQEADVAEIRGPAVRRVLPPPRRQRHPASSLA